MIVATAPAPNVLFQVNRYCSPRVRGVYDGDKSCANPNDPPSSQKAAEKQQHCMGKPRYKEWPANLLLDCGSMYYTRTSLNAQ